MIILKILFGILLCCPIAYVAIILYNSLLKDAVSKQAREKERK